LPNSKSVPIEMSGNTEISNKHIALLELQMTKLDEIIYQMQTSNSTSQQMLRVSLN
jgi:hypothetical protein